MSIFISELEGGYFNALVERRHDARAPSRVPGCYINGDEPQPNACHANAERWVEDYPDYTVVRGWIVEAQDSYFTMLVAHSLVRNFRGELIEITPQNCAHTPFLEHLGSHAAFSELLPRFNSLTWPPPEAIMAQLSLDNG